TGQLFAPVFGLFSGKGASLIPVTSAWSWTQAQSYCRTYYTDLASARDITESNSIASLVPAGGSYWFGLFRDHWKWSNGGQSSYTNWAYGQPDGSTDTCVAAGFGDSGLWRGRSCSETKAFICYIGEP
uniref:C-type lectin domain-containing protein n=1 Tax=Nothobranchius furzeri TaxID=105023 RepID=A0A8C6KUM2_NOTFU